MSRLRQDAAGRVYGIGGLMTVRDNQGRAIPAIEGRLDIEVRRVLLRIEPAGWERERYGDVEAIARKLGMLAETLGKHARLIQERGHA
jgi:hypothetical protein